MNSENGPTSDKNPLDPHVHVADLEECRAALDRIEQGALRWNADPEDVERSVAKLVLTLVDFVRRLLELQALRRMEAGTLTEAEEEALGLALMRLEETLTDMAERFGLSMDDLGLDLGPLGTLT